MHPSYYHKAHACIMVSKNDERYCIFRKVRTRSFQSCAYKCFCTFAFLHYIFTTRISWQGMQMLLFSQQLLIEKDPHLNGTYQLLFYSRLDSKVGSSVFSPFLQVFDVQRKITYKNLANWYKELREYRPEIPCCVVANKIDGASDTLNTYTMSGYSVLIILLNSFQLPLDPICCTNQ